MNDISEYYTKDLAVAEEVQWLLTQQYKNNLDFILPEIKENGIKSVVEFGCGTGLIAQGIPSEIYYIGIDMNRHFLEMARKKNPGRMFHNGDIRTDLHFGNLSCAFAFLKHFSLDEWDGIFAKVITAGKYAAFDIQILDQDLDDGTEYHHVFVTERRIANCLEICGYREVKRKTLQEADLKDHGRVREVIFWVEKT
jgi:SAM-dependent methyltransferase